MNLEKSLRAIDTALLAVRDEAVRKLTAGEDGVVGLEVAFHHQGGVHKPRWWSRREIVVEVPRD
jgi:hypothetical protein